ncbi:3-hydroxyacyl-ACP dehydratase [Flavobacterium sp. JP2137]|uniref:3-hydroxyacyl-ACP dehydratase n=1 Tax=Flavobacterium sp. JP2137 TaxID=3414510 RepID=UPI003D2FA34C
MLLKDFYSVESLEKKDDKNYIVWIKLNKTHDIFKGHFPNNPVTPGVCMMQIIKELSEDFTGQKLFMSVVSNVKFMALINPEIHSDLRLEINLATDVDQAQYKVKTTATYEQTVALKMSTTFKIV